jgi:alpha-glucosidase
MVDVPIPDDEIVDPPARIAGPDFPWWNRDQCRSPMAWTGSPGAGFTNARPWLRIGEDARHRNVAAESADPGSVLSTYRRLLAVRRDLPALRQGSYETLDVGDPDVFAWRRATEGSSAIVTVNFALEDREIAMPAADAVHALVGTHLDPPAPDARGRLVLRPLEGVVLAGS